MTLRDAVTFIDEVQGVLDNSMGLTDGYDVKECIEDAIKPLEKARKAIEDVADEIDTAFLILAPNREV